MLTNTYLDLRTYIAEVCAVFPSLATHGVPWNITTHAEDIVGNMLSRLGSEFIVLNDVAIHRDANVEQNVTIKGPAIISRGCFIAAYTYLRGGVFLDERVKVGPSCEVKASFVFHDTALAHLNYVGNSIIGANVNLEAGAVLANCLNEKDDKEILVFIRGKIIRTGVEKFGALLGDGTRIGANAVTTPGTILAPGSVVGRLELVNQLRASKN